MRALVGLGFVTLFSLAGLAQSAPQEKLLSTSNLFKDKLEYIQAADSLHLADNKLCYEIGLFSERAFNFTSVAQDIDNAHSSSELTLSESLRIKLTTEVSDLEGFCNHSGNSSSLAEGDRPALFKRLEQISALEEELLKSLQKKIKTL